MDQIDLSELFNHQPYAKKILAKLTESGFQSVIVGGAIRDLLRSYLFDDYEFEPEKTDVDIATSAGLDQIRSNLPNFNFIEVGAKFGVLIAVAPDGKEYEIAQFRSESGYDGRRPNRVKLVGSLEKDIERRDFTVNGLAVDREGKIYDFVDGVEDLKKRVIRAIGDPIARFQEDYLRPLRAIRIACDLDATIEEETYKAIDHLSEGITSISWERINLELFKILETHRSARGMRTSHELGLLEEIFPEMADNEDIPQPEKYHPEGDVLEHSFVALEVADKLDFPPLVKLATFLHDVGKAEAYRRNEGDHLGGHELIGEKLAGKIANRLRLSNKESEKLRWIVGTHMKGSILHKMKQAKQVKLVRYRQKKEFSMNQPRERYDYFTSLLQTIIADSEASVHGSDGWLPVLERFTELLLHFQDLEDLGTARKLINGNDLKDLGLPEGRKLGTVLETLHEMIYAGEITKRKEALEEAKIIIQQDGPL